MSEIRIQRKFI